MQQSTICPAGGSDPKSTQEVASSGWQLIISTQFLASILRSHVWLRKAPEPVGQIVDCCTTAWSPSYNNLSLAQSFEKVELAFKTRQCNSIINSMTENQRCCLRTYTSGLSKLFARKVKCGISDYRLQPIICWYLGMNCLEPCIPMLISLHHIGPYVGGFFVVLTWTTTWDTFVEDFYYGYLNWSLLQNNTGKTKDKRIFRPPCLSVNWFDGWCTL